MSFGFLPAAAVPIFAAISNARPGFLSIFFPIFLAAFPTERKKSPNPSACIVWSETMRLLFFYKLNKYLLIVLLTYQFFY